MFSTPLICCSIGVTTVEATTSALAPGYWPDTVMVGGAISGYCAIGSRKNATPPRITNTIETTEAKIGRSMKKCEMRIGCGRGYFGFCGGLVPRRRGARFALFLRRDLLARPRPHQTVHDDAVIGADAALDHAQIVIGDLAERHVFRHDLCCRRRR